MGQNCVNMISHFSFKKPKFAFSENAKTIKGNHMNSTIYLNHRTLVKPVSQAQQ